MALDVEGVVDGSVCGKEFLCRTRTLEPLHLALPPPRRLMRILNSIVLPSPPLVPAFDPKDPDCGAVRSQVVGDQSLGNEGVRPQELAHQFQRGVLISLGLDQHIEDLAFGVDSSPEVDHSAVDFQIESSGPGEFHPQALTDPDVSVSAHPAPTVRPLPDTAIANARTAQAPDALRPGPSAAHAEHALSGVDISTSPSMPGVYRDALALGKVPICDTGHSS